jgi:transposase-like protein
VGEGEEALMDNKLAALINLAKHMPEKCLDQAIEALEKIKGEAEREEKQKPPDCPHCHAGRTVRNGHRRRKQQYLCRKCGKSFVRTTGTMLYKSRSGEAAWKQIIRDTINGIPIDRTAGGLGMHHKTVFNIRHKVLFCLETAQGAGRALSVVLESEEMYILESVKGKELPEGYWRAARKHGAVSCKGGISDEYICGAASYKILEKQALCSTVAAGRGGFYRINEINGYHSFIKERNRDARGFGTKYLNRYNALFSRVYRSSDFLTDDLYKTMRNSGFETIAVTQTGGLLAL